jgi:hypothetical protein
MSVVDAAVSEHESIVIVVIGKEGEIGVTSPAFAELLVLPIEVRLGVVFNELSDFRVATELTHEDWNAQPFHVS